MTINGSDIFISYDGYGNPLHITYNGVAYAYVTNLQGDVVALLDSSGTAVVQYTYDAWGKILTCTGTMATTLGVHNPLRYRGYVYDTETGLYYLQSRYYNPDVGRFINADALVSTGQGLLGNNMFAYCGNNPVNRVDTSGLGWTAVLAVAISAVVGVASAWIGSAVTGQEFTWLDAGVAALCGAFNACTGWGWQLASSLISGGYSAYCAYKNGANGWGIFLSGATSFGLNMVSFSTSPKVSAGISEVVADGFVDFVFGTGTSAMDSAISNGLINNNFSQVQVVPREKRSAIDTIKQKQGISHIRVVDGRMVQIGLKRCSYPERWRFNPITSIVA